MAWKTHSSIADARSLQVQMQAEAFLPVAISVLEAFDGEDQLDAVRFEISPLYNCRERGYVVVLHGEGYPNDKGPDALHVFFAEHRNSDGFFVWHWEAKPPFNMPPELGDEESYRNRACVGWLRFDEAYGVMHGVVESWIKRTKSAAETWKSKRQEEEVC